MALVNCSECAQAISEKAEICPNCGISRGGVASKVNKAAGSVLRMLVGLFVILLLIVIAIK